MSDLEKLIQDAMLRYNQLSEDEKMTLRAAQRRSWVVGEMMLEHEDMTRAEAERLYDKWVGYDRGWPGKL